MPRSKTRALMRARFDPEKHWAARSSKAFRARVQRLSFAITKRHIAEDAARQRALAAAHEKAPDLATGGFNSIVIPGEDPGPPETQAPAAVPVRRAARWTGMTVLTD